MSNIDWNSVDNNVQKFSLNGMKCQGKIVSVYDGDTVNIVLPLFGQTNALTNTQINEASGIKLYKFSCRLSGVDTPELRTKNVKEKEFGLQVRDKLREKVLNKVVNVECYDFDKYGRLLIDIYIDDIHINKWLITEGYAKSYDGGTKSKWFEDW